MCSECVDHDNLEKKKWFVIAVVVRLHPSFVSNYIVSLITFSLYFVIQDTSLVHLHGEMVKNW